MLIALHSMCQPGRPGPQGLGQNTSPSSGLWPFQSAKSLPSSFSSESAVVALSAEPSFSSRSFSRDRVPYSSKEETLK